MKSEITGPEYWSQEVYYDELRRVYNIVYLQVITGTYQALLFNVDKSFFPSVSDSSYGVVVVVEVVVVCVCTEWRCSLLALSYHRLCWFSHGLFWCSNWLFLTWITIAYVLMLKEQQWPSSFVCVCVCVCRLPCSILCCFDGPSSYSLRVIACI